LFFTAEVKMVKNERIEFEKEKMVIFV